MFLKKSKFIREFLCKNTILVVGLEDYRFVVLNNKKVLSSKKALSV